MKKLLAVSVLFCSALCMYAQPPQQTLPLSNEESLTFQLLNAKMQLAQRNEQDLRNAYGDLVKKLETKHPGYTFNPNTGQLQKLPTPEPTKPTKPAKK